MWGTGALLPELAIHDSFGYSPVLVRFIAVFVGFGRFLLTRWIILYAYREHCIVED